MILFSNFSWELPLIRPLRTIRFSLRD